MNVCVVDYGMGNIGSILNMVKKVGGSVFSSCDADSISRQDKLILPGVGAFDSGMGALKSSSIGDALRHAIFTNGSSLMGICLGMQLLLHSSEEGRMPGLSFVEGVVKKFEFQSRDLRVPHMGWNDVRVLKKNPLLPLYDSEQRFYFVHSYHVALNDENISIGSACYGYNFCAAFQKDNIFGVQFHPEKSHRFGMALMKRFLEL
ncbi:MAG: imidazole glycerol phosphate synthase subunit HisH [Desulfomicrobium sp.]|nr:imidazole glycerol phosphate synthase subunit HisH [Desulfomicrobium sp.]